MKAKKFFLMMVLLGTAIPWMLYGFYLTQEGFNVGVFLANGAVAAVLVELIFLNLVFLVWSYLDASKHGLRKWWLLSLPSYLAGFAVPMALYIYFRITVFEKRRTARVRAAMESAETE